MCHSNFRQIRRVFLFREKPEGDQDAADKAEQSLIDFGARGMYLVCHRLQC